MFKYRLVSAIAALVAIASPVSATPSKEKVDGFFWYNAESKMVAFTSTEDKATIIRVLKAPKELEDAGAVTGMVLFVTDDVMSNARKGMSVQFYTACRFEMYDAVLTMETDQLVISGESPDLDEKCEKTGTTTKARLIFKPLIRVEKNNTYTRYTEQTLGE